MRWCPAAHDFAARRGVDRGWKTLNDSCRAIFLTATTRFPRPRQRLAGLVDHHTLFGSHEPGRLAANENRMAGLRQFPPAMGLSQSGTWLPSRGRSGAGPRCRRRPGDTISGEKQLGANRSIVGHTVRLNGIEFTVSELHPNASPHGPISPARVVLCVGDGPKLAANPQQSLLEKRDDRELDVKGRLKPE